jgi:3-deoxy-D-manno-octulosonate 8-phosphate phosphatase (KDO 8-P phosphatase)
MNVKHQLQKIKLIISDVDGVLTDGTVLKGGGNMELKRFCVQDGTAVAMVKAAGFDLAFISGRYSEATEIRMKELKVSDVYNGTLNKLVPYRELKIKYQLKDDEIAYIGDDLIDIPVMEKVGLPAAVQNAYPDVKEKAVFVTKTRGGEGAFREFIDWMLMELGTYKKCLEDMQIKMVDDS